MKLQPTAETKHNHNRILISCFLEIDQETRTSGRNSKTTQQVKFKDKFITTDMCDVLVTDQQEMQRAEQLVKFLK
jgi:hypothetical protein